jgi:hypothetical protein
MSNSKKHDSGASEGARRGDRGCPGVVRDRRRGPMVIETHGVGHPGTPGRRRPRPREYFRRSDRLLTSQQPSMDSWATQLPNRSSNTVGFSS